MKRLFAVVAVVLLFAVGAMAEMTNQLTDKEVEGRALAQKILNQWPTVNFTNTGVLKIRDAAGKRLEIPVVCQTFVTETNWLNIYEATSKGEEDVTITHAGITTPYYLFHAQNGKLVNLSGNEIMLPFANSDFWLADLGLEFFHWPAQKVLKREVRSSRGCTVLESTDPNPATNGYSRVVSWIDTETLGIVEADAYDANGKQLKIFEPKDFKKVNGQWRVETLVMENVQTGSRSRLEFDLKK